MANVYAKDNNGIPFSKNPHDNVTIAASHEWSEAVTDPDVNRGMLGWYDKNYGEIGDIPILLERDFSKMWERLNGLAVQKEWSNTDGVPEVVPPR